MNLRNVFVLEEIKNERTFQMHVPFNASFEESLEVANLFVEQLKRLQEDAKKPKEAK